MYDSMTLQYPLDYQDSIRAITVLAAMIPFATPNPNAASPKMTPSMGPGISMIAKFMFIKAIKAGIMRIIPLKPSSPATRNDLCLQETIKAAIASPRTIVPIMPTSPACSITSLPIRLVRENASEAMAKPAANANFDFVTIQSAS